ncbi:5'/3'-nucleotidase SurE [Candidatus Chloroploca asiatica]|uniref:5'-nucleotidase SurE n=1 Tax=Candidatus Chloroploca asiatica TaxID=1506545 RepID=A0A2H3L5W2_9CHLR|nr:5'/3'-nucleotidase SurE [Candidatus Chloroploca asiatica]PDW00351.1 hypothetical protein A9Q02_10155 [Candidatus Chloroploca asiatica]
MQILVVNDDGIASVGLWMLAAALRDAGLGSVTIVAPEVEQSGTSMALPMQRELTMKAAQPLTPEYAGIEAYTVNSTPVGCVLAGVRAFPGGGPDIVVSGINRGLNTGTNVLLSGTVGAAMFAAFWGMPALAVSQMFIGDAPMPWATATWAAVQTFPLLERVRGQGPLVLNVNVPHVHDLADIRGFRQTELSAFFYGDVVELDVAVPIDTPEERHLGIRFVRERMPAFAPSSDDGAVREGYISVTPLTPTTAACFDLSAALQDLTSETRDRRQSAD